MESRIHNFDKVKVLVKLPFEGEEVMVVMWNHNIGIDENGCRNFLTEIVIPDMNIYKQERLQNHVMALFNNARWPFSTFHGTCIGDYHLNSIAVKMWNEAEVVAPKHRLLLTSMFRDITKFGVENMA